MVFTVRWISSGGRDLMRFEGAADAIVEYSGSEIVVRKSGGGVS
jgi:hypothetical protein